MISTLLDTLLDAPTRNFYLQSELQTLKPPEFIPRGCGPEVEQERKFRECREFAKARQTAIQAAKGEDLERNFS